MTDDSYCRMLLEEQANLCNDKDAMIEFHSRIAGLSEQSLRDILPISANYRRILNLGLTGDVAESHDLSIRWVVCRVYDLHVNEDVDIVTAFSTAWNEYFVSKHISSTGGIYDDIDDISAKGEEFVEEYDDYIDEIGDDDY